VGVEATGIIENVGEGVEVLREGVRVGVFSAVWSVGRADHRSRR
jgi:D-arabinose 1-dehydrogenase-like Zn-dependent alcohol dehydrogenase